MKLSLRRPLSIAFLMFISIARGAAEETVSLTEDLVGALNAAVSCGKCLEPFDLVAELNESTEYSEKLEESRKVRFRLHISNEKETLIWAADRREERVDLDAKSPQKLYLSGTVIRGDKTAVTNGVSGAIKSDSGDYVEAVGNMAIPHPAFWGLFAFPSFQNNKVQFADVLSQVYSEDSSIARASTRTGLRYVLKYRSSTGHLDQTTWDFELPDMNPTHIKITRSLHEPPHTLFEQDLTWEDVQGIRRPVVLIGSALLVRPKPGNESVELGKRYYDLQVSWLPLADLSDVHEGFERAQQIAK
jgi:hypothetical protein